MNNDNLYLMSSVNIQKTKLICLYGWHLHLRIKGEFEDTVLP